MKRIKLVSFLLPLLMQQAIAATAITIPPSNIHSIMQKSLYRTATWGLRVIDAKTNKVLIDFNPTNKFYIGSVRKIFTVGELLNEVGANYHAETKVNSDGKITAGTLNGNLVLVAAGDLTMGGRTKSNGKIAFTDFDHNEADALGNAELTKTDPLAGYKKLAQQVKQAGIKKIVGDVVIDDRLFEPYLFRDEFKFTPMFINDDVVDVSILPSKIQQKAFVQWRPHSAAFSVINNLMTVAPGKKFSLKLEPIVPNCIGRPNCQGEIKNNLPSDFIPPLTNKFPLVQTFRIANPTNYARTVFIELLRDAGIDVSAITLVKDNPTSLLKDRNFYQRNNQVAALKSLAYGEHAKFIMKVSYNIGADTSLILFGLTQGAHSMNDSLRIEKEQLINKYGFAENDFHFIDGSGGGDTMATNAVVTQWLQMMQKSPAFQAYHDAFPILAVDGSLGFVKTFKSDTTLQGAAGNVYAKTGTYMLSENDKLVLKGQALAGYIHTKQNHTLIFQLVVNNAPVSSIAELMGVFQDQGKIAATLWRDF